MDATAVPQEPAPSTATLPGGDTTVRIPRAAHPGAPRPLASGSVRPSLRTGVLVPIKAFPEAKVRLSGVLGGAEREALARSMAEGVLAAAGPLPVWVVCDDTEVALWAEQHGASVLWTPARGLNQAVIDGVAQLHRMGVELVTVVHADLPLVGSLEGIARPGAVVLAPDRRRDGTNVAALPTFCGFRFSYGAGSFGRHVQEAGRLGLALVVLERPDLAWDVDVPDDLGPVCPLPPAPH